jgi:hypothetical protein
MESICEDKHIPGDDNLRQMWRYFGGDYDLFVDFFCYLRENEGKELITLYLPGDGGNSEMGERKFHRHAQDEKCHTSEAGLDFLSRSPTQTLKILKASLSKCLMPV